MFDTCEIIAMQNKIYVGNLSYTATADALKEFFASFGDIIDVAIPTDSYTKKPRGFAFVTFEGASDAQNALNANGKEFMGRSLKVNIAKEREKTGGSGDRGGDRGGRGGDRGGRY